MGAVLFAAALIWGIGWITRAPVRARLVGIGLLYVAVVLLHLVLPEEAALRRSTGGSAGPWLILGGVVLAVWLYRMWLSALRARVPQAEATQTKTPNTAELERNARHIVLREIGGPGQKKLKNARVLVIGAGGLGSPVLSYLAAAGVGTIGVIDDDLVDNSNLQRQVIHDDADIGTPKVFSAKAAMEAQNPYVTVLPYHRRLTEEIALDLFADFDLILDGSDNFETRYLSNRIAVATEKPLISGAITQWEGQVSLYDPARGGPCYQCVFPQAPAPGRAPTCAVAGVIAPLPGVIGSIMAVEAIKILTGAGESLRGRLMIYDALYAEARIISTKRRTDCPICSNPASDNALSA